MRREYVEFYEHVCDVLFCFGVVHILFHASSESL
jgi:hypothetical protein